jgi:CubicO group peptidase (beta-lactamase class C family)
MHRRLSPFAALLLPLLFRSPVGAEELPKDFSRTVETKVRALLEKTGAPSASIAVVKDGAVAWTGAFGSARIGPPAVAATPAMRYAIGSVSKQFTAAAVLSLAEEGLLSLDDKVVRWLPELTRAKEVSIRQLLSMTSGYPDFWPQDYVMPRTTRPVTPLEIALEWGRKPLDFEPGTKWQYSNTNYVIAGLIVEKASGEPLFDLLRKRFFAPFGMATPFNSDETPLGVSDAAGNVRYALGPLRPAPREGKGWMFAAGELSMTAEDLARWDAALIARQGLSPASWRQLESDVPLASGVATRYGLGVSLTLVDGRRVVSHDGEVSGFTAHNEVYPDDRAAVAVLVNLDATAVGREIAKAVREALFASGGSGEPEATALSRRIFEELQKGRIDRSLFTDNANFYFSEPVVADFATSLRPLGAPKEFVQQSQSLRGGMTARRFKIVTKSRTLSLSTYTMPDGKLEQYIVAAVE